MSETSAPLPLIPPDRLGGTRAHEPCFRRIDGEWLLIGRGDALRPGMEVTVRRYKESVGVLVRVGRERAERTRSGVRYIAFEFVNAMRGRDEWSAAQWGL